MEIKSHDLTRNWDTKFGFHPYAPGHITEFVYAVEKDRYEKEGTTEHTIRKPMLQYPNSEGEQRTVTILVNMEELEENADLMPETDEQLELDVPYKYLIEEDVFFLDDGKDDKYGLQDYASLTYAELKMILYINVECFMFNADRFRFYK